MIYLDTSAFVKLVWAEPETAALGAYLSQRSDAPLVSSMLLVLEARRAALRSSPEQTRRVDELLIRVNKVAITAALIETASRLPDPALRSLDAIHLATALQMQPELDALITYDARLAAAANQQRLPVAAPGAAA